MAPENEGQEQSSTPSDVDLLGFDPESAGTTLESEMKRVEALEKAPESESQAQEEDKAKPAGDPASQTEGDKKVAPVSEAEVKSEKTPAEEVKAEGGKFTFNGKPYDTEGEAEHAKRSFIGQIKSAENRANEAETRAVEAEAKLAESERLSQTPAKPEAEPKKPASEDATKAKGLDDFVNWKIYQDLYDHPDYGPSAAQRYLSMKNQEYLNTMTEGLEAKFDKSLSERFEPVELGEQSRAEFEETIGFFVELSEREDEDGGKLFPEIQEDTGDVDFITRVTSRYRNDESLKEMGGYGVYLALLAERDWEKFNVPAVTKDEGDKTQEKTRDPKTGKFTKPSEALTQFNKEREAAKSGSVVPDGDGTPRLKPGGKGRKAGTWQDDVLTGLEKAAGDQEDKMVLGY